MGTQGPRDKRGSSLFPNTSIIPISHLSVYIERGDPHLDFLEPIRLNGKLLPLDRTPTRDDNET